MSQQPEYWEHRIKVWEEVKQRRDYELAQQPEVPIKITLPDGSQKDGIKGKTTPMDIALSISKGLAKQVIVAKVNGVLHDACRPFDGDCNLVLCKFNDGKDVKEVFLAF
jgi:threonyl-tRNA synthetase